VHNIVNEVKVISFGLLSGHRQTYDYLKYVKKHIYHPLNIRGVVNKFPD